MNQIKTQEYRKVHDQLKELLLTDLAETLPERQARAFARYKKLQGLFLETLEVNGVNTDWKLAEERNNDK